MISASFEEKDLVVDILVEAFDKNKSVNYLLKQDKKREQRLRHLMSYAFDVCFHYGKVYLNDDKEGCALALFPDQKKLSAKSILLDLRLIFLAVGVTNLRKALHRESLIKKQHPKEPFYYLWFIGVKKDRQHEGIGRSLLLEIMKEAKSCNRVLCLETSTLENLPWYKNAGFNIYHVLDIGYRIYFLKRE